MISSFYYSLCYYVLYREATLNPFSLFSIVKYLAQVYSDDISARKIIKLGVCKLSFKRYTCVPFRVFIIYKRLMTFTSFVQKYLIQYISIFNVTNLPQVAFQLLSTAFTNIQRYEIFFSSLSTKSSVKTAKNFSI